MARPRDPGSRRSKAEKRKAKRALLTLAQRVEPTPHVLKRREQFAFLYDDNQTKPEGRQGTIDQDVCDAIGQLAAVGLLDNHGHAPWDLVRIGRDFEERRSERYGELEPKVGSFERRSPSTGDPPRRSPRYDYFDKLDKALPQPPLAQLDRVSGFEPEGCRFESCGAGQ
jgi:hypothetical protein